MRLAWARSGDKGDLSNVGVDRAPRRMAAAAVGAADADARQGLARPLVQGEVERFHLPGIARDQLRAARGARRRRHGVAPLDPLGKGMAQMLLDMPIEVPRSIAREARGET